MKLSPQQYAQALHEVVQGKNHEEMTDIVMAFVARLRKQKQIKKADAIVRALARIEEQTSGVARVTAVVAREETDKAVINQAVAEILKLSETETEVRVRPGVLGGLLLRTENSVWDATVRTKLNRMKRTLSKE